MLQSAIDLDIGILFQIQNNQTLIASPYFK